MSIFTSLTSKNSGFASKFPYIDEVTHGSLVKGIGQCAVPG